MKIQLNISDDPNFYQMMDFMFATDGFERFDYERLLAEAEAEGNGFGFTYFAAIQKEVDKLKEDWGDCESEFSSDWLIQTFNSFDQTIRAAVDNAMGEYLLSHNGHIDSWPVPVTEIGFELKGKGGQSIQYEFEYFGSDFSVQNVKTEGGKTMTAIGRGRGLVYRSGHTMQWRCDNLWHREWFDICDSIMFGFEEAMDYMP